MAVWLVAMLGLGWLARPAAAWLLPGLDHDALAIPLALAILGVVGHLVGHLAFGWPALVAGLAVLAGASYSAWSRVDLDRRRFGEAAAVFTAAFLFMIAVRAIHPAAAPLPVAIGEKMLDFGLLQSLLRAPQLPPEDMWFAGETVRYHYGGHMLAALLATLTLTAGRFAYNLALAGFYATRRRLRPRRLDRRPVRSLEAGRRGVRRLPRRYRREPRHPGSRPGLAAAGRRGPVAGKRARLRFLGPPVGTPAVLLLRCEPRLPGGPDEPELVHGRDGVPAVRLPEW